MTRRAIAELIARARDKKGLTQPELADLIKVDRQQVYKWEHERAIPATRNLPALADALDLSLDELYALHSDAKDEELGIVKRETSELRQAMEEALGVLNQFTETYGEFHAEYQRMGTQINQLVEENAEIKEELAEIKRIVQPDPRRERP